MIKRRNLWAAALGTAAVLVLSNGPASGQVEFTTELVRKAKAAETEGGLCSKVNWSTGTRETYVRWLEGAMVGTTKVNKFASGDCQYDEVTRISSRNGRKCVHYNWYTCDRGAKCGIGGDVECRDAKGDWARDKK
jgi:hypothetical protein